MELNLYFHDRPCGVLHIDRERMSFSYLPAYSSAGGPPISVVMPTDQHNWADAIVFPFFENLLPEGSIRQILASRLGTSENNFSRLLESTGGDVAGAISIHPPGQRETPHQAALPPALTDHELGQILEQIKTQPFLTNNTQGMRLSLAGAQSKLPVVIDQNGELHLTGQFASTHIIKPPSPRFPALVENEYLCMRAAARAGLITPQVALRNFVTADGQHHDCYVVQRYDRTTDGNTTSRLHQEDVCQITSTVSAQKYTQDGGPGFGELFQVIRQHARPPAVHQQELVRRMLFNLMIGNQDAHAKNFSLLHTRGGPTLAPAYDLVSTLIYEELQQRFAMPIGHAWTINDLDSDALHEFQQSTGINLRRQAKVLQRFISSALKAIELEATAVEQVCWPQSHPMLHQIVALSRRHANQFRQWLA